MHSLMREGTGRRRSCFDPATYRNRSSHQAIKTTWEANIHNLVKIGAVKNTRRDGTVLHQRLADAEAYSPTLVLLRLLNRASRWPLKAGKPFAEHV
jgi:hypothetical protein